MLTRNKVIKFKIFSMNWSKPNENMGSEFMGNMGIKYFYEFMGKFCTHTAMVLSLIHI